MIDINPRQENPNGIKDTQQTEQCLAEVWINSPITDLNTTDTEPPDDCDQRRPDEKQRPETGGQWLKAASHQ